MNSNNVAAFGNSTETKASVPINKKLKSSIGGIMMHKMKSNMDVQKVHLRREQSGKRSNASTANNSNRPSLKEERISTNNNDSSYFERTP